MDNKEIVMNEQVESESVVVKSEEIVEMTDAFDFDGYQVVRREFFAHVREPSICFNNYKFNANAAALNKFPQTDSIQVMVNKEDKILAIRPCEDGARDSYNWCINTNGKRKPRPITCKLFFAKICDLMNWNPNYKYKMLGRVIHANGEYLLAFDLNAPEIYQRFIREGEKPKTSRTPIFPGEWQDQFGLPYNEHQQSMQINIFDGYAIYAIQDNNQKLDAKELENGSVTGVLNNTNEVNNNEQSVEHTGV